MIIKQENSDFPPDTEFILKYVVISTEKLTVVIVTRVPFAGGSLEQVTTLPWQYQRNFTGCISALFFNEVPVDLLGGADLVYGTVTSCS